MKITTLLLLVAGLLLTGCASVESTRQFTGMRIDQAANAEHFNGEMWGIYFLPMVPLFVPNVDNELLAVDIGNCVDLTTKKAQAKGYTDIRDLQSHRTSKWIFPTLVLWYKDVQVSCNAVK